MVGPLIETKLYWPRQRRASLTRSRLSDRLSRGVESALTLVSAPAGFGKTTVLTEWLAAVPAGVRSVAWVSLDERDNDPALFWRYVVVALRMAVEGDIAAGALSLLESSQAPIDIVLATLLNNLRAVAGDVVLVLDDYQVIEAGAVHEGMAFVLEHLPSNVHVVIAARADPPLSLGRLRGDGQLVEIRAADLRFTPEESFAYLSSEMGPVLTEGDVAALEARTEGWIVALQLAALSMRGRDDVASFIAGFAGDDRYIVDYLAEEVLDRQPEDVRQFLLKTSILDRLNGSLCDSVTTQSGGKARLEALERGNLFVVPLDDRRRWYRYHHLFADVLRAHLLDEQPEIVAELHSRASAWYEDTGEASEAIGHALAAKDFARAANLAEMAIPALFRSRQEATIRGWMKVLPEDVVRVRPVLTVEFVGALVVAGEFEGVEARLRDAERWLDATATVDPPARPAEMVVVDEAQFRFLPSTIGMYRAAQALVQGDLAGTLAHTRRVLEMAADDDHLSRASAAGLSGLALWASGDLKAGYRAYADCADGLRQVGNIADISGCSIALADIRKAQGRLGDAVRVYEQALQLFSKQGDVVLRGTADLHVGISALHCERNDLQAAREHLRRSEELGEHNGLPQNPYRWRVAMARIRQAEGDLPGAAKLLDEAERVYVSDFFPNVRPIPALRARLRVAQGELDGALAWVRDRGLSVDDDLDYLAEFEHITLARILLARHAADPSAGLLGKATLLLERLLAAAEAGARAGAVIEILIVQALVRHAGGDTPGALTSLELALPLAEPEGYVRLFADEGPPMAALLRALAKQGSGSYVRRLLAAVSSTTQDQPAKQHLIDPLSDRELDVLRLLGTDLGGPEIARELMVSLNTMRTHTKNIYAKLGVTNRRAAVRKGQELQLLSRAPQR